MGIKIFLIKERQQGKSKGERKRESEKVKQQARE
jgi:hypothetical protein